MARVAFFSICLLVVACKSTQQTSTSQRGKYYEDLSAHRPKVEQVKVQTTQDSVKQPDVKRDPKEYVAAENSVNKKLDAVLDSIDTINRTRRFIDGFSVQVYLGSNREEAMDVRKQLITLTPEIESTLQYSQPNFIVRAGKYFTRLQAQKDYQLLKKHFSGAIVVPDKIQIK